MKEKQTIKGFALLIAIVVVAIILSLGLATISTALKELILTSISGNSLKSVYVADTGTECLFYWDNVRGSSDPNLQSRFAPNRTHEDIECDDKRERVSLSSFPSGDYEAFVWLEHDSEDLKHLPCAYLEVNGFDQGNIDRIEARSWGFTSCNNNDSRRVDRAFQLDYARAHLTPPAGN